MTAVRPGHCPGPWHWTAKLIGIAALSTSLVRTAAPCSVPSPLSLLPRSPRSGGQRQFLHLLPQPPNPLFFVRLHACLKASTQSLHKREHFQPMQVTHSRQREPTPKRLKMLEGQEQGSTPIQNSLPSGWYLPGLGYCPQEPKHTSSRIKSRTGG